MAHEELPKQFLASLKTLFDILDEEKTGFVRLRDIESRWQTEGTEEGLPSGVVDALRKVTPPSGQLTFDRFVAGLKIALLRSRKDTAKGKAVAPESSNQSLAPAASTRIYTGSGKDRPYSVAGPSTSAQTETIWQHGGSQRDTIDDRNLTALSRWPKSTSALDKFAGTDSSQSKSNENLTSEEPKSNYDRRQVPRRHTLTNGIDFNMIKRLKQLEQERDILLSGLAVVDCAREWYQRHLVEVQEKQKYISTGNAVQQDSSIDTQQERLNFQAARILEVNQLLQALIDNSEKGFPRHMNLAVSSPTSQQRADPNKQVAVQRLMAQNRMLTQELSQKDDKITQLEREKAQLIREMFQASSKNRRTNYDDSTFI